MLRKSEKSIQTGKQNENEAGLIDRLCIRSSLAGKKSLPNGEGISPVFSVQVSEFITFLLVPLHRH